MTEAEHLQAIAHAATNSYAALDRFQRAKRERYAAQIIYNFLRAFERFTHAEYAGDLRVDDLKNLLEHISEDGTAESFDDHGAPHAFFRGKDRSERRAATFADYAAWAIQQSHYRKW